MRTAFPFVLTVIVLTLFSVSGCERSHRRSTPQIGGVLTEEQTRQNDEAFQNVIELFNTLEETPTLRGLPGVSVEQQRVGQLDKWIAGRPEDKLWKPDPFYEELYKEFQTVCDKLQSVLDSFEKLRNEEEEISDSVETQQLIATLAELPQELEQLAAKPSLNFEMQSQQIKTLAERFKSARNAQEAAILARVDQVKTECDALLLFHKYLNQLTQLFDVRKLDFQTADADYFKQIVFARNISNWARGDKQDEIDRAIALFDWTIQNVDIRPSSITTSAGQVFIAPVQEPWQTFLLGHGTAQDRAWIFIELLRQQRIDACLLGIEREDRPGSFESWAVGVLSNDELYLFLPEYGVAIPGPQGVKLDEKVVFKEDDLLGSAKTALEGAADSSEIVYNDIATLSQVATDDSLLRRLDTDLAPFPLTSERVKKSVAFLFVSPNTAAQRMSIVQKELSGHESMVLYQSYEDQKERFSKMEHIVEVRHSMRPIRALYERESHPERIEEMFLPFYVEEPDSKRFSLWAGRVLYFKGKLSGEENAIIFYREARVSDRRLNEYARNPNFNMTREKFAIYLMAKRYAKYWIGLACYENGKYLPAKEHFEDAEKDMAAQSGQLWSNAIAYNLGRTYEKLGLYPQAIERYKKNTQAPTALGNAVRAKWLKGLIEK